MKIFITGCLCLLFLGACNVKNSDEYKALQAERDSLRTVLTGDDAEMTDMMEIINQVEENFNQIKEAEKYLTIESKKSGDLGTDSRTRIKDNFEMINELLKKNKNDIAKLNQRLNKNSKETAGLKKTIERLNSELLDRANTVEELRTIISGKDEEIAKLEINVQSLASDVNSLSEKSANQESKIQAQDKELNTAYYMFGTSKELKEAQVVTGGFLASTKVLNENIEKSKFITIDIREIISIPLYSKKAKLLTDHPKDSYTLEKNGNKEISIKITDYKRFWSLSKFMIVEVN